MQFHLNTTSAKGDLNAFTEILCNHVYPLNNFGQEHKSECNHSVMDRT